MGLTTGKIPKAIDADHIQDGYDVVTAVGDPGVDTALPTEKAVRDVLGEASGALPYMQVEDQKPSGTNGGAANYGTWYTRDLNTTVYNDISGASLASNQVTLPAGTYYIEAVAPFYRVGIVITRLYDAIAGVVLGHSTNTYTSSYDPTISVLRSRITLPDIGAIELQYLCADYFSRGLGMAASPAIVPPYETYSVIGIWKID